MLIVNQEYKKRIDAVIDYITANLDRAIPLDELAGIANFSSFHFHRIFVSVMGESVNYYTNRLRLEKAARLLKLSKRPLADIAYESGFSSPATFSRSFKKYFEVSPSQFRKTENLENRKICKEYFPFDDYLVPMTSEEKREKFPVVIKDLPKRKVAYIRVFDSYQEGAVLEAFDTLITWSKKNDLFHDGQFFGMSLDDPLVTPKEKYRYEACLILPEDAIVDTQNGIQIMEIPKCKYATTVVSGNINIVATGTSYLFNEWLVQSTYEPEHQYGLELFLDNENICNWEHFDIELCIPVKPLIKY